MKKLFAVALSFAVCASLSAKDYVLKSPDGNIAVNIKVEEKTSYSVDYKGKKVVDWSEMSMDFSNGVKAGIAPKVKKEIRRNVDEKINPVVPAKNKVIENKASELELQMKGDYSIVFRAYDDGVAYRFETAFKKPVKVNSEVVQFNFDGDYPTFFGREESMYTHQERVYERPKLSEIGKGGFCSPPMIVTVDNVRVLLTEADLEDYAGLYIESDGGSKLKGKFPYYPVETEQYKDRNVKVTKTADYMAQVKGTRTFPWRTMIITDNDAKLIESEMVYKLAAPCRIADPSWIKVGKVAWDWWTYAGAYGVDFKAGPSTEAYKYYIDFASKYGLEYIILDEGWYDLSNILKVMPNVNVEELVEYGKSKNVGLILWATWKALEDREDEALAQFEKWGVKGIKIDFMQRDDQVMVQYYYRIAEKAAKHKLLVDYHGSYKPTGLHHTYPNVITYEGVKGLENMKWSALPDPEHNVTLPFLRMVAGPMDYTPGGMINVYPEEFVIRYYSPMTIGTRCHQLGLYIVFESPLQMLADTPSNYYKEAETMEFLEKVPSTWDETRVIDAAVADYVVVARRKGDTWYLGALTDWTPRNFDVKLDFLGDGKYTMTSWEDGPNVEKHAIDAKKSTKTVDKSSKVNLNLTKGGGFVAIIEKSK